MTSALHIVCPHCDSINRVLRERLREGGKCGSCHRPLFEGRPAALNSVARFDKHATHSDIPLLADFWASWCGPCRMENPNVVATYQKFRNKNFTVLGVSLDKARDPWLKAIKDDGLGWTQVSDLKFWYNEVAVKYHIQQIPQNFLIDPNGKIVGRNLRGPDLQDKLCQLLGCN